MNINRGFEIMIPKREEKPTSQYKNQIRFKLFNRVFSFTLEVKENEK